MINKLNTFYYARVEDTRAFSTINCNTIVDIILQYILPFILALTIIR